MNFFKRLFSKKKNQKDSDFIYRSAVIKEFSAPVAINKGEKLKVVVSGVFSDLGWKMEEAKAEIKNNEIILDVIGKKKAGMMSAQALKPYDTVIEIKGLKQGDYVIRANKGTNRTLMLKVE
ncbi:MAG: hypothetical protein FK731_06530 [Asgard group archaeon]|nr:hypothetical protein [Asgard group archaeon]